MTGHRGQAWQWHCHLRPTMRLFWGGAHIGAQNIKSAGHSRGTYKLAQFGVQSRNNAHGILRDSQMLGCSAYIMAHGILGFVNYIRTHCTGPERSKCWGCTVHRAHLMGGPDRQMGAASRTHCMGWEGSDRSGGAQPRTTV